MDFNLVIISEKNNNSVLNYGFFLKQTYICDKITFKIIWQMILLREGNMQKYWTSILFVISYKDNILP